MAASQVECGAGGCRHLHPVNELDLVVGDHVGPGANPVRAVPIGVEHLGWRAVVLPVAPCTAAAERSLLHP
jgi:hypothetical protein